MKMKIIGVGIFSLALVLGIWSYSQATGNEITICAKKSGLVYVIGDGFRRADCKKNDQYEESYYQQRFSYAKTYNFPHIYNAYLKILCRLVLSLRSPTICAKRRA